MWVLVVWWWWCDWSFIRLSVLDGSAAASITCCNKIQNKLTSGTGVHRLSWKMAVKWGWVADLPFLTTLSPVTCIAKPQCAGRESVTLTSKTQLFCIYSIYIHSIAIAVMYHRTLCVWAVFAVSQYLSFVLSVTFMYCI